MTGGGEDFAAQLPRMVEALITQVEAAASRSTHPRTKEAARRMLAELRRSTAALASQMAAVREGKAPNQPLSPEQLEAIRSIPRQLESLIPPSICMPGKEEEP